MHNDYHHWVEMPNDILLKVAIPQNIKLSRNGAHFDPVHDWVRGQTLLYLRKTILSF